PCMQHWPANPLGTKSATSLRFRSWRITRHSDLLSFFLTTPPPPRSTLFPYTTLFRSGLRHPDRGFGGHRSGITEGDGGQFCVQRSEEHTSELQSQSNLVCRLLLEKKKGYH